MILNIDKDGYLTVTRITNEEKEMLSSCKVTQNENVVFVHGLDIKVTKNVNIDFMVSFIILTSLSKNKSVLVLSVMDKDDDKVSPLLKKLGFLNLIIKNPQQNYKYYKFSLCDQVNESINIFSLLFKEFVSFDFRISITALFYILTTKLKCKNIITNSYKNYLIMSFDNGPMGLIYNIEKESISWCGNVIFNSLKDVKNVKKQ
jgi:hypothetical protein